jgi:hypothetical protein
MVEHPSEQKMYFRRVKVWQLYVLGALWMTVGLVVLVVFDVPVEVHERGHTMRVSFTTESWPDAAHRTYLTVIGALAFGWLHWVIAIRAQRGNALVDQESPARPRRPLRTRSSGLVQPPRLGAAHPFRDAPAPPPIVPVQPRLAHESPLVQGLVGDAPKILT